MTDHTELCVRVALALGWEVRRDRALVDGGNVVVGLEPHWTLAGLVLEELAREGAALCLLFDGKGAWEASFMLAGKPVEAYEAPAPRAIILAADAALEGGTDDV